MSIVRSVVVVILHLAVRRPSCHRRRPLSVPSRPSAVVVKGPRDNRVLLTQSLECSHFKHVLRQQVNNRRVVDQVVAPFGAHSSSVARCIRESCRKREQVCRGTKNSLSFWVAHGDPWYLQGSCRKKAKTSRAAMYYQMISMFQ